MKKILIRSGINPFDQKTATDLLREDFVGGNNGNLIFAHGIIRNLTTDNVVLESDYYRAEEKGADYVNENYDAFVIPLADAFRPDFMNVLRRLTKFIKELKIPVYLIGAGIRAPYNVKKEDLKFEFDNVAREFISAILEKSSMVGLRGDITAQYLTNLGFKEGVDHVAIGCPSMYTYGENLSIRDVDLTKGKDLLLSTNRSKSAPEHILNYIHNLHNTFSNASFLPQGLDEFQLLYTGLPIFEQPNYPSKISDIEYVSGNARYFINATTWIDYLRERDFTFGTKLHGNITATIAGTPSISIPIDGRMNELAQFHNLATLRPNQIKGNEDLFDLIAKVDLKSAEKNQKENYQNFIEFLKVNGLDYTYQDSSNAGNTPYDKSSKGIVLTEPISVITNAGLEESQQRIQNVYQAQRERQTIYVNRQNRQSNQIKKLVENKNNLQKEKESLTQKNESLSKQNELLSKEYDELKLKHEKTLNRKAVKIPLSIADKIANFKK